MGFDLSTITRGRTLRPPRIVLCGTEKVGKSTFASQFPGCLLIPIKGEEGVDAIDAHKTPTTTNWNGLLDVLRTLWREDHPFKTIAIDSLSALEPLIWEALCKDAGVASIEKVGGGFGKGYVEALNFWRRLTEALDALRTTKDIATVLIGHTVSKTFSDPLGDSYDQYVLAAHKSAAALLYRWADAILFASPRVVSRTGRDGRAKAALVDSRRLYTRQHPAHPGGGRGVYGHLPEEMDLSYAAWAAALQEAQGNEQV